MSCDVVGYAVDSATLFDATVQLQPDVVLLDFSLPGGNALESCRQLKRLKPEVMVVAFTAHNNEAIRQAAYEAGCSAFVGKLQAPTQLLSTIEAVVEGAARSSNANTA
jgi:two-component system response regulator NreC